jgi:hypothetical protein
MTYLSKSLQREMGCETYFAAHHLATVPARYASEIMTVGSEFHSYRAAYTLHLKAAGMAQDEDWAREWLRTSAVSPETAELIEFDLPWYSVNPENIFGVEVYLSIDADGKPVEMTANARPGRGPDNPRSVLGGTLDLIELDKNEIRVPDYKSGWLTNTAAPYEAAHNSLLALIHFPQYDKVRFIWEFIRRRRYQEVVFCRDDMREMRELVFGALQRRESIEQRWQAKTEPLGVNPFAGLCSRCQVGIACPLVASVEANRNVPLAAVRTDEEARQLAARIQVARVYAESGREVLRTFIDQRGSPLPLWGDYQAGFIETETHSYPLPQVLDVLGYEVVPKTDLYDDAAPPPWDVPLDKLTVSASKLSSLAKAKKRPGMKDAIEKIADRSSRLTLEIAERDAFK